MDNATAGYLTPGVGMPALPAGVANDAPNMNVLPDMETTGIMRPDQPDIGHGRRGPSALQSRFLTRRVILMII